MRCFSSKKSNKFFLNIIFHVIAGEMLINVYIFYSYVVILLSLITTELYEHRQSSRFSSMYKIFEYVDYNKLEIRMIFDL